MNLPFGVRAFSSSPPSHEVGTINPKEIPIGRTGFDGGVDTRLDGFGDDIIDELKDVVRDRMIDRWGLEGVDEDDFDLEGILEEGGLDGDSRVPGRSWGGLGAGAGFTRDSDLVSDYYGACEGGKTGEKGDPYSGNPFESGWLPFKVGGVAEFGVAGSGGYSSASPEPGQTTTSADEKAPWSVGGFVSFRLDSIPKYNPASKPKPNEEKPKGPDVKPKEKPPTSVEQGVDDPKKPKPGTGTARPNPMVVPIGLPPPWDSVAWTRIRGFRPRTGQSDEPGWGGSEAETGGGRGRVRLGKVDWELLIGGGYTDPRRDGETREYGPRRPKRSRKVKVRTPVSDDPSVYGPGSAVNTSFRVVGSSDGS